jgi:hypothetical protein
VLGQKEIVKRNIQFILSHFDYQEYKFPRAIMTLKTKGQVHTNNEEEILKHFLESDFKDCRINGYPFYEENANRLYPSFIFIDLDLSLCSVCKYPERKLDYILKQTLNKIEKEINGVPTVLWTGGGYHIYQPITADNPNDKERTERRPLEHITAFNEFLPHVNNDLTTEFMRFAAKYFTNNQKDPKHNPSTKSCLIRVPETINSKYNFRVEIRQKWDGKEANANIITSYFQNNLMQTRSEQEKKTNNKVNYTHINKIGWIEKLLETPLADNRKYCLWKILIPYLANIKKLPKYEIVPILIEWLDKCDRINSIDFRPQSKIEDNLRNVKNYMPISLDNLKDDNFELYKTLKR